MDGVDIIEDAFERYAEARGEGMSPASVPRYRITREGWKNIDKSVRIAKLSTVHTHFSDTDGSLPVIREGNRDGKSASTTDRTIDRRAGALSLTRKHHKWWGGRKISALRLCRVLPASLPQP